MLLPSLARALAALGVVATTRVAAITMDPSQTAQVKAAASTVAADLVSFYASGSNGHFTPKSGITGLLTYPPYFWWEAGGLFTHLIEYWLYTGDDQYNSMVSDGILWQSGDNNRGDLMPANQTKDEGNDDQAYWSFAYLTAAESNFPNPPPDKPQWLAIAQSVFNQFAGRWDPSCNGGVRWQMQTFGNGYNYKNVATNGGFFQLAARLARYTGNQTYTDWANKVYDWMEASPLLSHDYQVFDGTDITKNCADADQRQWSYNYATMIMGAAYMWNLTNGNTTWQTRLNGFIAKSSILFPDEFGGNVMVETACEQVGTCDIDQFSFKSFLARAYSVSLQLAPFTLPQVLPKLQASGAAAATQCNGSPGSMCGSRWYESKNDGSFGAGQSMSALSMIQSNLVTHVDPPVTESGGGTSKGDPSAGTGNDGPSDPLEGHNITGSDRAGAGIITFMVLVALIGGSWFMVT